MTFASRLALAAAMLPLLPISLALAMGSRQPAATLTGVACEIVTTDEAGKTMIQGRITPEAAMEGSFTIEVVLENDGVTARSESSGTFSAAAGETVTVGRASVGGVTVNGATQDNAEATMTITVGGASRQCAMADASAS